MIVYGYVKEYMYTGDGTLMIKVRIPSIHGPMAESEYKGQQVRNYVRDNELPFYPSILLPHLPTDGEVVALTSTNNKNSQFMVLGLTGGSYYSGTTNIGE